jgi:hypothetical protein
MFTAENRAITKTTAEKINCSLKITIIYYLWVRNKKVALIGFMQTLN